MALSDSISLELFMKSHEEFDSVANFNRIMEVHKRGNARMNDANILAIIQREGIGYTAEYQQALQDFYASKEGSRWGKNSANTRLLIERFKSSGFSFVSAEALASCVAGAGLAESAQYKAAQSANNERVNLIRAISGGKASYSMFVKAVGTFRNFATADLQNESTERLREIAAVIEEQNRVRGLDANQVRTEIHQNSQRYSQYLPLPDAMPDGRPWSIYNFNKQPVALIKDQIRKYGVENINAACQAAATQGAR